MADFSDDFSTYAVSKLPTSRDNFNYSTQTIADLAWVTTDTAKMRVDPVNEKIEIDAFMDGTDDHVTFDLGFIASDRWVMRGKITLTGLPGVGGAGSGIYFGLSANKDDNSSVFQDNAYMGYLHASSVQQWGCSWGDTSLPTDFFNAPIVEALPVGTQLFWELKREGNVITGQIFNNSDFTDSRGISTLSTAVGTGFPENLRFIKFYNRFVLSTTNRVTYEVDDIEFWDERKITSTFQDMFDMGDNWTDNGTGYGVNTSTQVIDVTLQTPGGADNRTDIDLGLVSNTNWVLRYKFNMSALTAGSRSAVLFGLFDLNVSQGTGGQNSIISAIDLFDSIPLGYGGSSRQNSVGEIQADLVQGVVQGEKVDFTFVTGTDYFVELIRLNATTVSMRVYSDPSYSIPVGATSTITILSSVVSLRFLRLYQRQNPGTGTLVYTIDDVEFYDGVSSVPKRLGSQQGDITFQDNFELKPVTFSDDFSGTDNWTDAGTAIGVNVTTDVIDWNVNDVSINHATAFDLGVNGINNDSWTLRAKVTINNVTAGASADTNRLYFGLFDSDQSVDSNTIQDGLFLGFLRGSTANQIGLFHRDGVILDGSADVAFTSVITATTFFVEIKRTSSTSVSISLFSDATYLTLIESQTATIPAGITGLRFIKAQNRSTLTGDSTLDGTIDDVEFYNGNSTLTDWISKVSLDSPTLPTVAINTTTKALEFAWINHFESDTIYHDLLNDGITVSETDWTLRCKVTFSDVGEVTINVHPIGLYDNDEQDSLFSPQDFVNIFMSNSLAMRFGDGINLLGGVSTALMTFPTVGVPVFWEIKRIGGTTFRFTQYSDSLYTDIIDSEELTGVPSTVDGLRFIKILNRNDFPTFSESVAGKFEDIEFYNGVSVPRTPVTEPIKLFDDSVVTNKGWVTTDATAMAVNLTTQVLDINVLRDSTQDAIAFDLGAGVLSETRWGLRFKYDITAVNAVNTGTKRIVCGLFDTNQTASIASPQDSIHVLIQLATDTTLIRANATDGTNPQSGGFFKEFITAMTQVQTYYIEIIRISATSYSVEIFSDPDYQISIEKQTIDTISSGISGLRYIKFLGDETSGPVAGSFTGTIDDIQLWNDQAPLDHKNKWRVLDL